MKDKTRIHTLYRDDYVITGVVLAELEFVPAETDDGGRIKYSDGGWAAIVDSTMTVIDSDDPNVPRGTYVELTRKEMDEIEEKFLEEG